MAHKAIISKKRLGWLDKVEIGTGQQGVMFKNGRWQRTLLAGETLSWSDLSTAGCDLYLLDCRPHTIQWRVDLPAKNHKDHFPLSIEFSYQIQEGYKFIESGFADTEALIEQKLKLELRRVSRLYEMPQYEEAATAVAEALEESGFFETYGLLLDGASVDVIVTFSDDDIARISGKTLPQQVERQTDLPSKDNLYPFEAKAAFKYRVVDKNMPAKGVKDAAEWLWRELLEMARAITVAFPVNQLPAAEEKLRASLSAGKFHSDGVEVISAFIALSLGERARRHAEELDEIERGAELDSRSDERRIAHLNRMITFYERYLPADMRITALGMGDEQVSIREAIERLDTQRQEQLAAQMSMFKDLLKADALPETIQEKAAEALMGALSGYALRGEVYLSGPEPKPLLTDDDDEEEKDAPTKEEEETAINDVETEIDEDEVISGEYET